MKTQFKKGVLDLILLHVIHQSPRTAYSLLTRLKSSLDVSQNTIYPLLRRLEKIGYLTHEKQASDVGAPKKMFTLTSEGLAHYQSLFDDWQAFQSEVNEILLGGHDHD